MKKIIYSIILVFSASLLFTYVSVVLEALGIGEDGINLFIFLSAIVIANSILLANTKETKC